MDDYAFKLHKLITIISMIWLSFLVLGWFVFELFHFAQKVSDTNIDTVISCEAHCLYKNKSIYYKQNTYVYMKCMYKKNREGTKSIDYIFQALFLLRFQTLKVLYEKILRSLQKLPEEAQYRRFTEQIICERLAAVKEVWLWFSVQIYLEQN